jgi:hypothetical protein
MALQRNSLVASGQVDAKKKPKQLLDDAVTANYIHRPGSESQQNVGSLDP